jgi:hypothetical protein
MELQKRKSLIFFRLKRTILTNSSNHNFQEPFQSVGCGKTTDSMALIIQQQPTNNLISQFGQHKHET